MQTLAQGPLDQLGDRFTAFLPDLVGGLGIVAIGVVVGWLARRAIIAFLKWLRLDRLGGPTTWRAALAKADVREALYGAVGGVAMVLVVLVFLDDALQRWGLLELKGALDRFIGYLPNLVAVAGIVTAGLLLSNVVAERIAIALEEAGAPNPRLVGGMSKAALLAIVGALALWELDFARQIVMGAFLIGFGAIGVAFALAVGIGSSQAIRQGWEELFEARKRQRSSRDG